MDTSTLLNKGFAKSHRKRITLNQSTASIRDTRDITAGVILICCALASLIAVTHHPVITARQRDEVFVQIRETAFTDRLVHGALILCSIALLFAFCRFAQRQGIQRTSVLLGLIFYVSGTAAMIGAALIDGFFVPEIGTSYPRLSLATADTGLALLRFCSIAIQLFTKFSMLAVSIAMLLWSISFARAGRGPLLAALIGVVAALSQGYILWGGLAITAHTIVFVVAAEMGWYLVVGLLLITGQL
jgi:hypothetical protein